MLRRHLCRFQRFVKSISHTALRANRRGSCTGRVRQSHHAKRPIHTVCIGSNCHSTIQPDVDFIRITAPSMNMNSFIFRSHAHQTNSFYLAWRGDLKALDQSTNGVPSGSNSTRSLTTHQCRNLQTYPSCFVEASLDLTPQLRAICVTFSDVSHSVSFEASPCKIQHELKHLRHYGSQH